MCDMRLLGTWGMLVWLDETRESLVEIARLAAKVYTAEHDSNGLIHSYTTVPSKRTGDRVSNDH